MDKLFEQLLNYYLDNEKFSLPILLATIISLLIIIICKLYKTHKIIQARKDLAPYFNKLYVKDIKKLYIETQAQNISPVYEEEQSLTESFRIKTKLIPYFIKKAFDEKRVTDKYFLILGGSGMGKTTFLISLYLKYQSVWNLRRKYKMKLIPFGIRGDIITKIKEIKEEEKKNTILLLDAFDEYSRLLPSEKSDGLTNDERFRKVLDELIDAVHEFRKVVITCRTQYFPGQDDKPYTLKVSRFDDKGYHNLGKLYLSPFDKKEINTFLNKKYGRFIFYNKKLKDKAKNLVLNTPKLLVRPMLLSYIDILVCAKKEFTTVYSIYDELINGWIEREGVKCKADSNEKQKFILDIKKYSTEIALKIYDKKIAGLPLTLSKEEAVEINTGLKDYQITGKSLLNRDSYNSWQFAHKSILEFYLARQSYMDVDFGFRFDCTGLKMSELFINELGISSRTLLNYKLTPSIVSSLDKNSEVENKIKKIPKAFVGKIVEVEDYLLYKREIEIDENFNKNLEINKKSKFSESPYFFCYDEIDDYVNWLSKKNYKKMHLANKIQLGFAFSDIFSSGSGNSYCFELSSECDKNKECINRVDVNGTAFEEKIWIKPNNDERKKNDTKQPSQKKETFYFSTNSNHYEIRKAYKGVEIVESIASKNRAMIVLAYSADE